MENSLYKSLIHQTAILKQLDAFRASGRFCDVTVGAGGKTFKCHRVLLAASSSYFESLFLLGQQMQSDHVTFVPLVSASSFEEILRFIYMAEFTISPDNADDLLEAATMLRIQPMVEAISHFSRSFQEGAATHTERTTGSKSKLGQDGSKPSQDESSSGLAKKARLDDKILPGDEETDTTRVQTKLSTQRQLDSHYSSAESQRGSKKVYPEACYLTGASRRSQYDRDLTVTVKREREDPGYDVAAGSAGSRGDAEPEVPVGPDIGEQGRGQWAINKQSLHHDRSTSVLRKEDQPGAESTEEESRPTFRCALEENVATHGQLFEERLTCDKPVKREALPGVAGDGGGVLTESFSGKSPPASCNTDGQSVGMSAAELLKTLSRRYECAQHQQAQEMSDTELQRARPSPLPKDNETSESALLSLWQKKTGPKQADSDTSQFFTPSRLEHRSSPPDTRPARGPDQRAATAAVVPTLAALLESPASSSPPGKERAAWTGDPLVRRGPAEQYRSSRRLATGPTPRYQRGQSPEMPGQTDRPCTDERSSQRGIAQPRSSKRTSRRGVLQSRKSVDKILTRLLTRDSYRDTEEDVGCKKKDVDGEEWAGIGASQTLRSMCGEYLTSLPQKGKDGSGVSSPEVHKGDISGQKKEETFPQSAGEGGVLGTTAGTSPDGDGNKEKHRPSSDTISSEKEPRVSQEMPCLPEYPHVMTSQPVQATDPLSAAPSQHVTPGLLCSKANSESVGDDHWLTASETLRRISRTRTLADTRTGTEKEPGAVSRSAEKQEGLDHAGLQSQQGTSVKTEDDREVSGQDTPDTWQLQQTVGPGRTGGGEDSVIPGWSLRAETDRSLLGPATGTQGPGKGRHHTPGNTTSQARGNGYAACDILKSIIHYHGQERQDQPPR
ncbi:hypothetical protein Bbelb_276890 [Branchiostoma belcheri]|nr:hypothetical protein Bbelb_276890 [Branchiostoma belcheri]